VTEIRNAFTLLVAAPLAVVATLLLAHSVWLTFIVYHLGICLAAPAWLAARRGRGARLHLRDIGALPAAGVRVGPGVRAGLVCALLMGGAVLAAFALAGDTLLRCADLAGTLEAWGVTPGRRPALFAVMLLGDAPAEELFWRGWAHRRLAGRPRRGAAIATVAAAYASYHAVTVAFLTRDAALTAVFTAAVLGAGCVWGALRERHGHVWPAVLGHAWAVGAYMAVLAARL
jgi:membrane protease YdiL (CAAX protease family)